MGQSTWGVTFSSRWASLGFESLSTKAYLFTSKMKLFLVCCLVGASVAAPGGYTGIGGVYKNMNQNADYIGAARRATKMAFDLFNDESLGFGDVDRDARDTKVYVPAFFTSQPQPVNTNLPQHNRPGRQTDQYYDLPIYYKEYEPRTQN